jgi:hypothetical protein
MHRVGAELAAGEVAAGLDSVAVDPFQPSEYALAEGADVNVLHTHIPNELAAKIKGPVIWVCHGTPEYIFQSAVEAGLNRGYGASDPFMFALHWIQRADAMVTFWERHAWIWQDVCPKQTVHIVPMGINKEIWQPVPSRGKYAGSPSVFTAENCHYIKWPLDLAFLWPEICRSLPNAKLHLCYLPRDQHRWWFPLMNMNGCAFNSYIIGDALGVDDLKNAFCSTDYYLNLVRYGDHDRVGLEAAACGAKVISYKGNPYAHHWIDEGDQRDMAEQIKAILNCSAFEQHEVEPVPSIQDMCAKMSEIYAELI